MPRTLFLALAMLASAFTLVACQGMSTDTRSDTPAPSQAPVKASPATEHATTTDAATHLHRVDEPVVQSAPSTAPVSIAPADFWTQLRNGFAFDDYHDQSRVQQQIAWFTRHPDYMERVLERAKPFLRHIQLEVETRGMPLELVLLPIVESAFDPFAYSHGRAAGIWQFIPGTAKMFGLKQTWWYDGRRDVLASTEAALTYLERLVQRFDGDWLLALASYNTGPGNVSSAVRRNQNAGKPADFWSLRLPRETRDYVPRLIALAKVVSAPQDYGLTLMPIPLDVPFEVVDSGGQIDMALAASMAGMETDDLYRLNPGFNRWATDPDGPHELVIPRSQATQFKQALAALPADKRVRWERYTIRSGDSLLKIAKRFNTTAALIKDVNKLRSNTIVAGRSLLIPVASNKAEHYALSAEQRRLALQDREREGRAKLTYRVESGDSWWTIARRHSVDHRALAGWNGKAPGDLLKPGQTLTIWQPQAVAAASPGAALPNRVRRILYSARQGDSYAGIAQRFNVSLKQLRQWNRIDLNRYLQPGDRLTLYVDVTLAP